MAKVIVIQFITLDGVVQDPDGSDGTDQGGWAFRYGREAVAGDKFKLGAALDDGVLLFGRKTWEIFSERWPSRTDDFAVRMNRAAKLVVSRSLGDAGAWNNSTVVDGDLVETVSKTKSHRDVIVIGSTSVARELARSDLVDEYRLIVFPVVVGAGERLFAADAGPVSMELLSVEQAGVGALLRYAVVRS